MTTGDGMSELAAAARAFAAGAHPDGLDRKVLRSWLAALRQQVAAARAFLRTRPEAERV